MAVGDPSSQSTPHLVLGAARSGKSRYAEVLILACPPPYLYLATAQVLDGEMEERVRDIGAVAEHGGKRLKPHWNSLSSCGGCRVEAKPSWWIA
jgi:adenosyl cobinamide kinase/adenosyl cobinamide phosphate guanylyltransferase